MKTGSKKWPDERGEGAGPRQPAPLSPVAHQQGHRPGAALWPKPSRQTSVPSGQDPAGKRRGPRQGRAPAG